MLVQAFFVALIGITVNGNDFNLEELLSQLAPGIERDGFATFDVNDLGDLEILRDAFEGDEVNLHKLLSDASFLTGIPGLFKSGDGKRWATLNFAYQLACYQGETGSLLSDAIWAWRKYNGYGCYCGGGTYHGNYLDATDKCCQAHDECYAQAEKKYKIEVGCHTYTTPYTVSCCEEKKITKCTDSGPSAGRALCDCDQVMAECVSRDHALKTYNSSLYNNREQCRPKEMQTKPMGIWEVLRSCKHAFKPRVTFTKEYGSQGKCPKSSSGWWFLGKK